MIEARTDPGFDVLAARLAARAATLAAARVETLEQRGGPSRWRLARLLWPLFTKG